MEIAINSPQKFTWNDGVLRNDVGEIVTIKNGELVVFPPEFLERYWGICKVNNQEVDSFEDLVLHLQERGIILATPLDLRHLEGGVESETSTDTLIDSLGQATAAGSEWTDDRNELLRQRPAVRAAQRTFEGDDAPSGKPPIDLETILNQAGFLESKEWFDLRDVKKILNILKYADVNVVNVSIHTMVNRWCARGRIKHARRGGKLVVPLDGLIDLINHGPHPANTYEIYYMKNPKKTPKRFRTDA